MQISKTNIFSLPGGNEGFWIVYIEAVASGKTVNGYFLTPQEEVKEIGRGAKKFVSENFAWAKIVEKTIHVYKVMLYEA